MGTKFETLNNTLAVVSNIGVIIGIVFLAIEIQQNTNVNRSLANDAIQTASRQQLMAMVQDSDLLEIELKARDGEEMSRRERMKLSFYHEASLRHLENAFLQRNANLLDEKLFQSYKFDLVVFTKNTEFARSFWEKNKSIFSPEFQAYVDAL